VIRLRLACDVPREEPDARIALQVVVAVVEDVAPVMLQAVGLDPELLEQSRKLNHKRC